MAPCIVISKLYICKWSNSFSSYFINQYSKQHSSYRRLGGLQTSLEEPQHVHIFIHNRMSTEFTMVILEDLTKSPT